MYLHLARETQIRLRILLFVKCSNSVSLMHKYCTSTTADLLCFIPENKIVPEFVCRTLRVHIRT